MLSEEWHIIGYLDKTVYYNDSILGEENKNIIKDANKHII